MTRSSQDPSPDASQNPPRKRRANVALFVPHLGCPHRCSFCNQRAITGKAAAPSDEDIRAAAETALRTLGEDAKDAEIAFFGGSFTAIPLPEMLRMLDAAYPYAAGGRFHGIRVSTRPDAVDPAILGLLKSRGVTAVELGAQSMDDRVLGLNGRGHTAADVERAAGLIRDAGLELGLQMMTGLYGDSDEGAVETARRLLALQPATLRVYPAVVLKGTRLAALYGEGKYRPQTVEAAAALCGGILRLCRAADVPIIRLGLHDIDREGFVAGPWHPAFREICEGNLYLEAAKTALADKPRGAYTLLVPTGHTSRMAGQRRRNLEALAGLGYLCKIREEQTLPAYTVRVLERAIGRA